MKSELQSIQRLFRPNSAPDSWKVLPLKDLSLLKISNGAFNDPKKVGEGCKLINVVDLYQGSVIRTGSLRRLSVSESEYKTFKAQRGDLFFTRSSLKKEGIAHCNIFLSDEERVIYECHMMRVRPNPELVDPKYLQEFCLSVPAREYFISHSKTTTMTTIDQGSIGGLPVLLPSLPEQQKIAAILTAVDDKLDVIARQIAATKILKHGLMQTLFSSGVGSQDASCRWVPHTEFKDCETLTIPATWEKYRLGDIAPIVRRAVEIEPDALYPELGLRSYGKGTFHKPALLGKEVGNKRLFEIKAGDLLFSNVFAWEGAVAVAKPIDDGRFGSHRYITCVVDGSRADTSFIFRFLTTPAGIALLTLASPGGAGRNRTLGLTALASIAIPLPPLAEQHKITQILDSVDAKLEALSAKQTHYQTLKRGLMQKLLTGEWRVKLDTEPAPV